MTKNAVSHVWTRHFLFFHIVLELKAEREGGGYMNIEKGNIVTILQQKEIDGRFVGKQGYVAEVKEDGNPDGPIGVQFPAWYKHLFCYPNKPDTIIRFQESELRVDKCWMSLDVLAQAELLFGNMHSVVYWNNRPFIPGVEICQHEGCDKKSTLQILVNCWGTVSQHQVCSDHAVYHGRNCDGFPCRKPKTELVEAPARS